GEGLGLAHETAPRWARRLRRGITVRLSFQAAPCQAMAVVPDGRCWLRGTMSQPAAMHLASRGHEIEASWRLPPGLATARQLLPNHRSGVRRREQVPAEPVPPFCET